ncbi:MAG: carboxymuconolactone decarboxylase family protein [Candidatus Omnitrophica bacterium]|nr:carboxymuconolactone decarboxylase family protein [Candidatus Omnitrophota bacterium]MCB9747062.1 carboxymuconolactone decarboxylase family protein [Candidatus Omnitrophota bacterium]
MARIEYAEKGQEAPEASAIYESIAVDFKMIPNIIKLVGHSGAATQGLGTVIGIYFKKLKLDPRVKEIAYLTVARENQCQYCQGHHTMYAKQAGLSDEEISLLGDNGITSENFSEAERAVIKFALETTRNVKASDEVLNVLKKSFNLNQIVEIAFVVAAANFIQRIGKNFEADLEM